MAKKITVNVPDNVSYKKAKEAGLGGSKSLSVPQASGGNYRVAVGGTLSASETSMGRLASSLKGINNALGAYADIVTRREERSLEELRRMSNDKKRELIGAENKVFRKMGIRPQSILQVKQSLGTVETGKFQAEWQEHLDNKLIPSQAEAGDPLTASQIQQEYTKYRQGWAKDNAFLSKSQLATDGFLTETDVLYDRNSAYYFKSADGYYEKEVQRYSGAEAIWSKFDTDPENIAGVIQDQIDSMDTSTFRSVLNDMTTKAIASGDETMLDKMEEIFGTMADPANKIKLGSQKFTDTMTFDLLSPKIKLAQDNLHLSDLRKGSEERRLKLESIQAKVDEDFAKLRVDLNNAESPEEEKQIREDFYKTTLEPNHDILGQGYGLQQLEILEKERESLATIRRTEQNRQDTENTVIVLKPVQDAVYGYKTTEEINSAVEEQKKNAQDLFDSGSLSEKAYQDVQGKLHSLGNATTQKTMRAEKARSLAQESSLAPAIEAATISESHYQMVQSAKKVITDPNGNALGNRRIAKYLETSVMGDVSGYSYNEQRLNRGTQSILTKHTVDIAEKKIEIAEEVFAELSPTSGGEITNQMRSELKTRLAKYEEERTQQTTQELIDFSNAGEQAAREQELLDGGYSIDELSEAEINDRYLQLKQWERSVEDGNFGGMFTLSQDYRTGEIDIKIGANWAFDLDHTQPLTGVYTSKHAQFIEAYTLLHTPKVIETGTGQEKTSISPFDAASDETKALLSQRYREALQLRKGKVTIIDNLVKNLDRGAPRVGGMPTGPNQPPVLAGVPSYDDQTRQGRRIAEQKLFSAYELAGVPTEHWREQGYKDGNSEFTLRGNLGDVKSGVGYQKRKELAFVPVETIQKLHDFVSSNQATGNITADLQTALQNLPKEDIMVVKEALSAFYITGEKTSESSLQELFNNHRAIYSVKQGYNFYK